MIIDARQGQRGRSIEGPTGLVGIERVGHGRKTRVMHAEILKSENFLDSRRMCWTKQNTERLDQAFSVGYDRDAMLLNQGHLLPAVSPLSIKKFAARSFVGSGRPLWRGRC